MAAVTKSLSDAAIDGGLDKVATGTVLVVCSDMPATRAEAMGTYDLAQVVIDAADFTKANGDASGRKVTVGQQATLTVDHSGTATGIVICDGTNILLTTTCTSQVLTAGNTVTVPAFKLEIADPT